MNTHPTVDPTAYDIGSDSDRRDPLVRRLNGWTNFGGMRISMPYITPVAENLWHGGVASGLVLPPFIDYVLSLYPWEEYRSEHPLKESLAVTMFDSVDQSLDDIESLADWVNERRLDGPVLVHCQAGLNRSSLVVARALIGAGDVATGDEAVELIRAKRDPSCLCNPAFERWVRSL